MTRTIVDLGDGDNGHELNALRKAKEAPAPRPAADHSPTRTSTEEDEDEDCTCERNGRIVDEMCPWHGGGELLEDRAHTELTEARAAKTAKREGEDERNE